MQSTQAFATTEGEWRFEWLTNWPDLLHGPARLRLDALLEQAASPHPFFHPALLEAWITTRSNRTDAQVLFARHQDVELIWPLALTRIPWLHGPARVLVPAGYPDFDYHDPITSQPLPTPGWTSFWPALDRELDGRGISRRQRVLMNVQDWIAPPTSRPVAICPRLDFSQLKAGTSLIKRLPARLRGDISRQQRRLAEQGRVRFEVVDHTLHAQAADWLEQLERHHRRKWPLSPDRRPLHAALLHYGLATNLVHFSVVLLDDTPISWHLGFSYQSTFYWYLPVFDPAFAAFSPGKVHLYHCAQWAYDQGLQIVDLLRGQESYKGYWANSATRLVEVTPTLRGWLLGRQLASKAA